MVNVTLHAETHNFGVSHSAFAGSGYQDPFVTVTIRDCDSSASVELYFGNGSDITSLIKELDAARNSLRIARDA